MVCRCRATMAVAVAMIVAACTTASQPDGQADTDTATEMAQPSLSPSSLQSAVEAAGDPGGRARWEWNDLRAARAMVDVDLTPDDTNPSHGEASRAIEKATGVQFPGDRTADVPMRAVYGFALTDIADAVEVEVIPNVYTVFRGTFEPEAVEAAIGPLKEGRATVGEPGSIDVTARDQLRQRGEGVVFTVSSDLIAFAPNESLLDLLGAGVDDAVLAAAAELDSAGVHTAVVDRRDRAAPAAPAGNVLPRPFSVVAAGLSGEPDRLALTLVWVCGSEADAQANADALPEVLAFSADVRGLESRHDLEDVSVRGSVVVARLVSDEVLTFTWRNELDGDPVVLHSGG